MRRAAGPADPQGAPEAARNKYLARPLRPTVDSVTLMTITNCKVLPGLALALAFACLMNTRAADWPNWRGPSHNGVSAEKGWLDKWPDDGPKIAWKAKVGLGFSSVVVANGRVATAGHASDQDTVFCFDAETGKTLWKHTYPAELGDKYYEGGTTGTPTFSGDQLYWLSRWGDLFAFDGATGKILWQRNLQKEAETPVPTWGFTGAPLVHENLLILNVGDSGMAVDKATGKTVWESPDKEAAYSTPLPVQREGKSFVIIGSNKSYIAVEAANGKERWRMPWNTQYGVNAADPILSGDSVFVSSGYGKGAVLFEPWGSGAPKEVWKSKVLRTQLNPAVLWEDHVYGMDGDTGDKAPLKCIELATGKEKWSVPAIGSGGTIIADGKLIVTTDKGELIVAPATPSGFHPSARAQVAGGKVWTAPVLANGKIYCRNSRGDLTVVDVRPN